MLQDGPSKRTVRARIQGEWHQITEFEELPDRSIRVKLGNQTYRVADGHWTELTGDDLTVRTRTSATAGNATPASSLPSTPKTRKRLKSDSIPPEQIAVTFIVVGALILAGLIIVAVATRTF